MILVNTHKFPADPMAILAAAYRNDRRLEKFDLRLGVYRDAKGNSPIMPAVKLAERRILAKETTKEYLTPAGNKQFCNLVEKLVLGEKHPILSQNNIRSIQTPGAGAGLRIVGEIISASMPGSRLWISRPSWSHYNDIYQFMNIEVKEFSYYDKAAHRLIFEKMLADLDQMQPSDFILLQGCCHNPSGADLTPAQWHTLCDLINVKQVIPVLDVAYQGFGDNLHADAYSARLFAERSPFSLLLYTASKNFGLYNDRAGMMSVLSQDESVNLDVYLDQLETIAKNLYFMPPNHGASVVAEILADEKLQRLWADEIAQYQNNISILRHALAEQLQQLPNGEQFSYLTEQKGMFSILPLKQQVIERMRDDFAVYLVDSGRINIAGLSLTKIDYFVDALRRIGW